MTICVDRKGKMKLQTNSYIKMDIPRKEEEFWKEKKMERI